VSDPAAAAGAEPVRAALARLYAATRDGAPRDPARTRRLLDRLAVPDPPRTLHVVGTNGKGSVAARLDAGLRAAGARPLRFLSPHVERFHERIAVAGRELRDEELLTFLARTDAQALSPRPAFFELATALALDVAHRRGADWAVLEAGVGAARDATLAVGGVVCTVITDVAEDHLDLLGPDLEAVARDKAAAVRPGVPVVTGATGAPLDVVRAAARAAGAPLAALAEGGEAFAWPAGARPPDDPLAAWAARLAVAALRTLPLPPARREAALRAALAPPGLPARRERFALPGGRTVLLDMAHNPPAARALAAALPPGAHLLLGVAARKDARGVLAAFDGVARRTLTAARPGERPWGDVPAFRPDADAALDEALAALPPGGLLAVAGSVHLAGRLRPRLRARAVERRPADGAAAGEAGGSRATPEAGASGGASEAADEPG
jgi:dihydrofolate synthase/folylpolyglutamate synthase